jgi:hypothetical protein
MANQYQTLFALQVLHDYYNMNNHENKCADFDMVPTEDCIALMRNMQVLHRNFGSKLVTLIRAEEKANPAPPPATNWNPFIDFRESFVLRWYLKSKNPYFSNFTALALQLSERKRLYFSNLSNNTVAAVNALSKPVEVFVINQKYLPGHLVKAADGNIYEAVRISDGTAAANDTSNTNYWQKAKTNNPYVGAQDEVIIVGSAYNYNLLTAASDVVIQIFGLNKANALFPYDQLVETTEQHFTSTQSNVQIDFSKLPIGKYRMVVNSENDQWIYVDPQAIRQNVFGIVEIHHFANLPTNFQLQTAQKHLPTKAPLFSIWFKNRSVLWKYVSQNGNIRVIDGDPIPKIFEFTIGVPDGPQVKSKEFIALTETPITTLTLTKTTTLKTIKNLQNPEVEKLVFEKEGATGFFTSNMFIKIDI